MNSAIIYLLVKEWKQFWASSFLPKLVILLPVLVMLLMPWVSNMEIRNMRIAIVDNDCSSLSEKLMQNVEASEYFIISGVHRTYDAALASLEDNDADAVMVIPQGMEDDLMKGGQVSVHVAANAVNSLKSGLGSGYLTNIITSFGQELQSSSGQDASIPVEIDLQYRYNPYLDNVKFMVPGLMIIIVILICGFLPTMNIVGEKEKGTIEQINVTPVKKREFIFSKLIFYGFMGVFVFSLSFLLGKLVYGIAPYGGFGEIFVGATLLIIFMSGLGLAVSNFSDSLQQAVFVMLFFMMLFMLMSGIFTPIGSMEKWAQALTYAMPSRYFVDIMRCVCLKGSTFNDLWFNFMMLAIFAVFINAVAIATYKKQR